MVDKQRGLPGGSEFSISFEGEMWIGNSPTPFGAVGFQLLRCSGEEREASPWGRTEALHAGDGAQGSRVPSGSSSAPLSRQNLQAAFAFLMKLHLPSLITCNVKKYPKLFFLEVKAMILSEPILVFLVPLWSLMKTHL